MTEEKTKFPLGWDKARIQRMLVHYESENLSDEETAALQECLNACMPLDSMIVDLWGWGLHFEDDLDFDWYFEAAFGGMDSAHGCAEALADYFLEKIEEYSMDYNQYEDSEEFDRLIFDEAYSFVVQWRKRIIDEYADAQK